MKENIGKWDGVRIKDGEQFPWKGAWWTVVRTVEISRPEQPEIKTQAVVIIPTEPTHRILKEMIAREKCKGETKRMEKQDTRDKWRARRERELDKAHKRTARRRRQRVREREEEATCRA